MRSLFIALLSTVFVVARAQDQFPPTPDEVLLKAGIMSPESASLGWEGQARKVFSDVLALVGIGDQVKDGWGPAAGRDGEDRLRNVLANRNMILALLNDIPGGFLNGLSPEAEQIRAKLNRAFALIPQLLDKHCTAIVPDIPENHFIFEGLAELVKEGFYKPRESSRTAGSFASRLAIAVFLRRALEMSPEVAARFQGERHSDSATKSMSETLKIFHVLIDRVATELTILGSDPDDAHTRVAGVFSGPFSDVPANHWASTAIEALRVRGLLNGYPSGKFGGS